MAVSGDGFLDLDLTALPLQDLSVLSGLPVRRLVIKGTKVSDLAPLRGMPLTLLDASNTPIKDLAALAACPALVTLDVSQTGVSDLRPLAALRLDRLVISKTAVQDLAPLQRMPLRVLHCDETKVEDVRSLATCLALESATISRTVRDPNPLRKMPALLRLSMTRDSQSGQPSQSVKEFWLDYDSGGKTRETETKLNAALAKLRPLSGWKEERFQKQTDGTYKFDLSGLVLGDLALLRDLPISFLNISDSGVTRSAPKVDCPIREFYARGCPITDLIVLGKLPLEQLEMVATGPGDLQHLRGLKLRSINVHPGLTTRMMIDLSPLRGMPLEKFSALGFDTLVLKPLEGAPITELSLNSSRIKDLLPVRHMPLTVILLGGAEVSDISPLRNLPLVRIDLIRSNVRDVSPLAECKALESIGLPAGARGVEALRKLPNVKRISFEWVAGKSGPPSLTAEEFWAQFDKQKKP